MCECSILDSTAIKASSEVPVGQKQEGREEMSHVDLWRKNILIEGNVGGKARRRSVHTQYISRNRREVGVPELSHRE